jgi:hypothetical protein
MGTPSATNPAHQRLTDLRNGLIRLHKTLLDSERDAYEHNVAAITSSGQLLQLLMNDPYFDWLHKVSELIVEIDERLAAKEPAEAADAESFIKETRALLVPLENGDEFERRYDAAMQRDPDVIIAHGRMLAEVTAIERR